MQIFVFDLSSEAIAIFFIDPISLLQQEESLPIAAVQFST